MKNSLTLLPRLSEKTYKLSESNVYVVDVDKHASSQSIKLALESQFEIKVKNLRIVNVKGKAKRTISNNGKKVNSGKDNDYKKAYITLVEGNTLPFFNAIEEEEKQAEKTQEEFAKQLEKEDKKKKSHSPLRSRKQRQEKPKKEEG